MSDTQKKFYLTTPIYYVNARPHIGHAYTTIAADVIARRHRLLGDDTFFLTGTDEHGQKVQRSAAAAGIPPQQFADEVSATFRGLWKRMGITNDDYIRTTDARHKQGVQRLWKLLEERGFIYLSTYTGQYSVGEEMFVEGPPGTIGPDGKPTETVTEENYFFKLSEFQKPLLDFYEANPDFISPAGVRNEVLSFVRGNLIGAAGNVSVGDTGPLEQGLSFAEVNEGLQRGRLKRSSGGLYVPGALKDLSISRTTFDWGIPVPGNEKHVIYVWLDALSNYMTAVGYGSDDPADKAKFAKYWPADIHLVGKEITRFHCVYWPAFLLALNPALQGKKPDEVPYEVHREWADKMLPKRVVANGWLLFEDSKMSKSRGNIVRTETILDAFGTLCPPVPNLIVAPAQNTVILSGASQSHREAESKDPEGLNTTTAAQTASPQDSTVPTNPTKTEQDLFASDVIRYFLLREIPFGQDGSFSFDALVQRYNSDLANGYGNLVSRTLAMISQYFSTGNVVGRVSGTAAFPNLEDGITKLPINEALRNTIAAVAAQSSNDLLKIDLGKAVEQVWTLVAATDAFITAEAPWKLAKLDSTESNVRLRQVLYTASESIRIITALAYPILPYATAKVWAQLGLGDIEAAARNGELKNLQWGGLKPGTKLGPLAPIFPRAPKELIQIMTDMEQKTSTQKPGHEKGLPQVNLEIDNPAAETRTEFGQAGLVSQSGEAAPQTRVSKFIDEKTTHTSPIPADSTDPGAPPRTSALNEANPGTTVGGSHAITTERTPSPHHSEALASGIFANTPNSQEAEQSSTITIDDFVKIDLRVARIVVAERIPKADKLLRLEVDLGYERRQILSGIAQWYTPEELLGRNIVVIANLAPRKMRGLESHGMLLAASHGEDGKPILATFAEDIPVGSRLK